MQRANALSALRPLVNSGLSLSRSGKGRAVYHFLSDIKDIVGIAQFQASGESGNYSYSCLGLNNSVNEAGWTESSEYYVPSNDLIYPLEGNPQVFFTETSQPAGVWEVAGVYAGPGNTTFYYFGKPVFTGIFIIEGPNSIELWTGGPRGADLHVHFVYLRPPPPDNVMPGAYLSPQTSNTSNSTSEISVIGTPVEYCAV